MDIVQISTTTGSSEEAQRIADHLVAERLAACVQVLGPIRSTYRWRGSIETSEEFICFIKTRAELAAPVEHAIKSLHSYEDPEILTMPILGGSADYLAWVASETARPEV